MVKSASVSSPSSPPLLPGSVSVSTASSLSRFSRIAAMIRSRRCASPISIANPKSAISILSCIAFWARYASLGGAEASSSSAFFPARSRRYSRSRSRRRSARRRSRWRRARSSSSPSPSGDCPRWVTLSTDSSSWTRRDATWDASRSCPPETVTAATGAAVTAAPPPPRSILALFASSLSSPSLLSLWSSTSLFCTAALVRTSSLACLSATYRLSDRTANWGLIVASSLSPLPSAARRLSKGMVYPLVFFQLDMQAGTLHASRSSLDNFSGGACSTGTGSSAGPLGALRCMCLGGCIGSICAGTMRMTRFAAWGLYPGAFSLGVYRTNCVRSCAVAESLAASMAEPVGLSMATLDERRADSARWVRSAAEAASSSVGRAISSAEGRHPRRSECLE
mmetsp:Transcript_52114/g.110763  ORF Transcript_52114/g.110763 Transcript_52114/m.110763 type:complete len:395 (+) Transcript_52114:730-1914(+)